MLKSVHIFYSGLVQGVGFRLSAEKLAVELDVKGWVRNIHDGRVEIYAEGDEDKLEIFMLRLKELFRDLIAGVDVKWDKARGKYTGFDITF